MIDRRKLKAFTLIELLVVISIIALLLAVLMPSLSAVKKRAQGVVCRSNLKSIGLAASLYAQDYDSYVPRGANGNGNLWFVQFLPYLGNEHNKGDYRNVDIYKCKSFPRSGSGIGGISNRLQTVCFVVNDWKFTSKNDKIGTSIGKPTRLIKINSPASVIYMADNENGSWRPIIQDQHSAEISRCDVFYPAHLPTSDATEYLQGRRVARQRHRDGCNILYFDGHSDWIKAEDVTLDMWRTQ